MPTFDIESERPGGSFDPAPSDGWSMPLGRLGGIRFLLSYAVFVALAVLGGLVAMVQHRAGNQDLPIVALQAVSIWMIGWIVQVIVQVAMHFGTAAKSESITVGLVGIEVANPLQRQTIWSATSVLASAVLTLLALVSFGFACLVVHMITLNVELSEFANWSRELSRSQTSFGMDSVANCYLAATWLFWFQAACQAFPLPRNLGRGALAALVSMAAGDSDERLQLILLRRMIQLIAIVTVVIAMATMIADSEVFLPRWLILILLAIILWVSTRNHDLIDWVTSIQIAAADPVASWLQPNEASHEGAAAVGASAAQRPGWIAEAVDSVRLHRKRKRAKQVLQREREEASDAARLDHVLQLVSEKGTDGLNAEDKALLKRVSESFRRERESEDLTDQPDPNDPESD